MKNNDLRISLGFMAALLVLTIAPFLAVNVMLPRSDRLIQTDSDGELSYAIAIFPPRTRFTQILEKVSAADGVMIKDSLLEHVTYSASRSSNYAESLYRQGALIVFKPRLITSCYTPNI